MRLVARDQGDPAQYSYTSLVIRVEDADDQNPVFSQERYEAVLPSPGLAGSLLSVLPSRLEAADRSGNIFENIFTTEIFSQGPRAEQLRVLQLGWGGAALPTLQSPHQNRPDLTQ